MLKKRWSFFHYFRVIVSPSMLISFTLIIWLNKGKICTFWAVIIFFCLKVQMHSYQDIVSLQWFLTSLAARLNARRSPVTWLPNLPEWCQSGALPDLERRRLQLQWDTSFSLKDCLSVGSHYEDFSRKQIWHQSFLALLGKLSHIISHPASVYPLMTSFASYSAKFQIALCLFLIMPMIY